MSYSRIFPKPLEFHTKICYNEIYDKFYTEYNAVKQQKGELMDNTDKYTQLTPGQSREAAFLMVFEQLCRGCGCSEVTENADLADEYPYDERAVQLFEAVVVNAAVLDKIIGEFSPKRAVSRIGKVSLAVLRIAVYESIYINDIPVNVAVSEAVRLSTAYSLENDTKFVNGLLSSFARSSHIPEAKRGTVGTDWKINN